jgi:hypothetical protein
MRHLPAALLLLLAIFVPARAADFDYEKERLKLWEFLAAKHAELGDEYKKALIFTRARKQYDRARELEPDNRKAWQGLGYKKKEDKWVPDELMPDKDGVSGKEYLAALEKPEDEKKKVWEKCAERARKVMQAANKAGDVRAATIAAIDVLYYAPDDAEARKLRSYERAGDEWAPAFARKWRDEGHKIVEAASFGEELEGDDEQAKAIGVTFYRRGSEWLEVRTTLADPRAKFMHRCAEATIKRALELLGKEGSPFGTYKYTLTQLQDQKEYEAMLTKVLKLEGDELEFGKRLSGYNQRTPYGYITVASPDSSADDMLCNTVALRVLGHAQKGESDRAPWVDTGWGYFVTSHTLGSTMTQRYSMKEVGATTTGEEIIPEFTKKAGTPDLLREVVLYNIRHGADIPLEKLAGTQVNDMQQAHAAKSFSFMEFIYATQPEKARAWLKAGGDKKIEDQIKKIEAHFNKPLNELENDWREWVLVNY